MPTALIKYSNSADLTAEVVDVGFGLNSEDYEGKDIAGKIVLTSSDSWSVYEEAIKKGEVLVIPKGMKTSVPNGKWGPCCSMDPTMKMIVKLLDTAFLRSCQEFSSMRMSSFSTFMITNHKYYYSV